VENEYALKLNGDYYVVTANDLIKGKQTMTLREAQLLYLAIAQVVKEDTDFKTYKTTVPELAEFMGVPSQNLYQDLKSICEALLQRVVKIQIGGDNAKNKWKAFQWVNYAEYDGGTLTLRLSNEIKPFLLELEHHFSQTLLKTMLSFRSYYTLRLYQLIKAEQGSGYKDAWEFTCDELREFFQVGPKQYTQNAGMLKKTIKVAITELNNSDFAHIWDYEEKHSRRKGRALIGVSFKAQLFKSAEEKNWYLSRAKPLIDDYIEGQLNLSE
jgi:plasmid replication initiation protein